jgi:hypothetical protein
MADYEDVATDAALNTAGVTTSVLLHVRACFFPTLLEKEDFRKKIFFTDRSLAHAHAHIPKAPPSFEGMSAVYDLLVTNPQKQEGGPRGYVAYTIRVRNLRDNSEMSSFRRYSDFLWLHDRLRAAHPSCVVPPVPEKALGSKFSPELLHYRSRELTRFVQRIAAHPVLVEDE